MNKLKNTAVAAALVAAAILSTSCASKAAKAAGSVKATQKTVLLDDKGALLGIQTPEWVAAYILGNNSSLEKMPEYKDKYCFVVENIDANKDFAIAWVQNASGPQQIAAKISTTVASSASNKLEGEKGVGVAGNLRTATEQLSNASFNGATREGDWWQYVRNVETGNEEYRAWALWVIPKKQLDQQVAASLQRIIDQNAAMSAAEKAIYADLISDIRNNGGLSSDN